MRQAVHRAATGAGLRLLFRGPPGGGKTQYALWLAKRLGRDVMLKRPSDLLSKYIGDSEKQIASAFRNAARAGSVLIIDEADALLYDRSIATHSWGHSQNAEFLQQIQEYNGILIACTNRVDAVDPALRKGPPLMMSDLATAAEMLEIDNDNGEPRATARVIVDEILASASARDRTREIGF